MSQAGDSASQPTSAAMVARALTRRCPWCGYRKIFRRWTSMEARCPRCGLALLREEGSWTIAITINYGVTAAVWVVLFVVWLAVSLPHVNVPVLIAASVVQIVAVAYLFLPFSKTLTAALDLLVHGAHRGLSPEAAEAFGLGDGFEPIS